MDKAGLWYRRGRWWVAGLFLLVLVGLAASSTDSGDPERTAAENRSQDSRIEKPAARGEELEMTWDQKDALGAGQRYVDAASVSKKGLIRALSSKRRAGGWTRRLLEG